MLSTASLRWALVLLCATPSARSYAQEAAAGYRTPSPALKAIVDAPTTPMVIFSTNRDMLALFERPDSPSIAELAQPELRLAGLRINPATNGPSRETIYTGIVIKPVDGSAERRVTGLPPGARISEQTWSRDNRHLALSLVTSAGLELWVVDVAKAQARRLTGPILNAMFTDAFTWRDATTLIIRRVPDGRGAAPAEPLVPSGPIVQETLGKRAAARTYDGLLTDSHDEALFEHYATSELATVSLDGAIERLAPRAIYTRQVLSPDGRYLLVDSLHRPYSYVVPTTRFPVKTEILENGKSLFTVADLPLDEAAAGGTREGRRQIGWRTDAPATLSWVEIVSRRTGSEKAARRLDAWHTLAAPFKAKPTEHYAFEFRVQSVSWGDDALAFVTEYQQTTRTTRVWRFAPGKPDAKPEKISERSSQDRYGDPGRPLTVRNQYGRFVMQRSPDGSKVYLIGTGASAAGDRPFLDEFDLATKKTRRIWQSAPPHYEEFVVFTDATLTKALMRRESISEPTNYFLRTFETDAKGVTGPAAKAPVAITAFPNPLPQLSGLKGELIRYKRADGVTLSGTLYLPPGYKQGDGPLPTLLWAYPREYLSAETAEQVNSTPEKYVRVGALGPLPFVLAGYAVLNDPTMPIIGREGKQPNDTYIEQLKASAQAAVDELVRRGVSDRKRIAVAGHSYGAFMTANLLAHTDLFCAGIARSGAYNRTLTPFGFQAEPRFFWDAPEVYAAMSPFNHANKIKEPILLIHGEADNNSGTFPIQSERFYAALKGYGANARYVVLPHEAHGYRARESILHTLYEMETWLDKYVKAPVTDKKAQ